MDALLAAHLALLAVVMVPFVPIAIHSYVQHKREQDEVTDWPF